MEHIEQLKQIYSLYVEISAHLKAGADFVIGKIPGGDHYLVHCSGAHRRGEEEILQLLTGQMSEKDARVIWESHVASCVSLRRSKFLLNAYTMPMPDEPSNN